MILDPSQSNTSTVDVAEGHVATAVTMVLPTAAVANMPFDVTGVLTRADGVMAADLTVNLYLSDGTNFNDTGVSAVTGEDGSFDMQMAEAEAGTYEFQVVFLGAEVAA